MDESHRHQPASRLSSGVAPPTISFRQLAPAPCLPLRQQAWPYSPCATPVNNSSGTSLQHIGTSLPTLPSQLRQLVLSLHTRQISADQASRRQPLHNTATKLRGRDGAIDSVETGKPECACEVCGDSRCGYKPARNRAPDDRSHAQKLQRLHDLYKKRKSKAKIRCDVLGCNQVILNGRTDNLKEHKKSSKCAGFWRTAWGESGTGAAQQPAEELTSEEELRLVEAELEEGWLDAVFATIKRQDDAGLFAGSPPYPAVDLMPMMDFDRLVDADHLKGIHGLGEM